MMKPAKTAFLFAALASVALAASPSPTPTPTPAPTPPAVIVLADGKPHTAEEITAAFKEAGERIADLTQQRNTYLGQVVDLQAQLAKLQQAPPPRK